MLVQLEPAATESAPQQVVVVPLVADVEQREDDVVRQVAWHRSECAASWSVKSGQCRSVGICICRLQLEEPRAWLPLLPALFATAYLFYHQAHDDEPMYPGSPSRAAVSATPGLSVTKYALRPPVQEQST